MWRWKCRKWNPSKRGYLINSKENKEKRRNYISKCSSRSNKDINMLLKSSSKCINCTSIKFPNLKRTWMTITTLKYSYLILSSSKKSSKKLSKDIKCVELCAFIFKGFMRNLTTLTIQIDNCIILIKPSSTIYQSFWLMKLAWK